MKIMEQKKDVLNFWSKYVIAAEAIPAIVDIFARFSKCFLFANVNVHLEPLDSIPSISEIDLPSLERDNACKVSEAEDN